MKANQLRINDFLQKPDVQFVIPVYQRNYDWTTAQCRQLLNDIIAVERDNRESHFIGSIVYIHDGIFTASEVSELLIIDGQQRLTTLSILNVALYHFAKENNNEQQVGRLYNKFIINQYVEDESNKLKLKQTDRNSIAYKAILSGRLEDITEYSNVIENYNYFRDIINESNFKTIIDGLKRIIFVEVSLERGKDDPQRIFESLNSTGLDLTQSDLIRNYILMDLPAKRQEQVFKNIWSPIEDNARDSVKGTSLVSEFIRDYLTMRNKRIPRKNNVYLEFRELFDNKDDESFNQELEQIKSLSYHYKKFINPVTVKDQIVRKELDYINRLEINVVYPFLLQVFEDEDNGLLSKDELVAILQLIQSYTWRRFIVGLPTNALNKIFMTLYSEVDTENYYESIAVALLKKKGSGRFPTDDDLKFALKEKDLYNVQPKNKYYMFEKLENYNNKEFVDTNNELITIEHIFPQNPDSNWSSELPEEEYLLFKEKYLNTIGNLTLSGNNGALGNRSFIAKKMMDFNNNEQGYIYSRLWLNKYLSSIDKWDVANYKKRTELLTDRFFDVWKYPAVVLDETEEFDEVNIFDADIPTGKKLEFFIFEDQKVEENTISQMYLYVIRALHEKNSQLLLNKQDILKITRDSNNFRSPQEVLNGWFIEANVDSNSKFIILKKLLRLFELDDELYIKYSSENNHNPVPNRYKIRRKYWQQLLPLIRDYTDIFSYLNPSNDNWLNAGAGVTGISYTLNVTKNNAKIELTISTSNKELNKRYFKKLLKYKDLIEDSFGKQLQWKELPEYKVSKVRFEMTELNVFDESQWGEINEFFFKYFPLFENAFKHYVSSLR
ncbi:DUF4268 domain-containing protein [Lascolabacillus massiliensis]|jgi:uncharacterized protein with ParB-like and HNH nuclease domain|uniref:DUF4268 domain-containing protein n=1 Tax=Lascolabacillus massiliensis TaxID=1627894 RepID=UPI0006B34B29|nr:DUF4268 domain-containing protein [Lascolabacillus massiliensis]